MKHRFKKTQHHLQTLKRTRSRYQSYIRATEHKPAHPLGVEGRKVFIFEGEYVRLCKETILYGDYGLETGGQFFGYTSWEGTPVVAYVLGPGPHAQHSPAFFRQDESYLVQEGNRLIHIGKLTQIGEWHSHHRLGLSTPSGHDAQSMMRTIRLNHKMHRYLLSIATCNDTTVAATPFMFNADGYETWRWEIIPGESPIRKLLEKK